jgi:diguanylate cyclase (GGDEF)-like protein
VSELLPNQDESDSRFAAAARALARGTDLEATLDVLLRVAADRVGATVAVLAAIDDDRARIHFLYGLGLQETDIDTVELSTADLADPIVDAAFERVAVDSPVADEPVAGALAARLGLARVRALPLIVAREGIDQAVGVLAMGWSAEAAAGAPGPSLTVDAVADLAAVAVERARLAAASAERGEWAERLAHLDPLTGLANRRTFDRVLELEIARAGRQGSEVAVLAFDVDAFRATNESVGRSAGDNVLRAVAAVLAEQVRLVDTVARIGGDEFVIVAPGSGGMAVATRVINAIRGLAPVGAVAVSVSAGIARFPHDGTSGETLLGSALSALQAARASGQGAIAQAAAPEEAAPEGA